MSSSSQIVHAKEESPVDLWEAKMSASLLIGFHKSLQDMNNAKDPEHKKLFKLFEKMVATLRAGLSDEQRKIVDAQVEAALQSPPDARAGLSEERRKIGDAQVGDPIVKKSGSGEDPNYHMFNQLAICFADQHVRESVQAKEESSVDFWETKFVTSLIVGFRKDTGNLKDPKDKELLTKLSDKMVATFRAGLSAEQRKVVDARVEAALQAPLDPEKAWSGEDAKYPLFTRLTLAMRLSDQHLRESIGAAANQTGSSAPKETASKEANVKSDSPKETASKEASAKSSGADQVALIEMQMRMAMIVGMRRAVQKKQVLKEVENQKIVVQAMENVTAALRSGLGPELLKELDSQVDAATQSPADPPNQPITMLLTPQEKPAPSEAPSSVPAGSASSCVLM